ERMREYNTKTSKMLGVKTFITSCAEGYRTFKLDYKLDGVRIVHITQFLYERGLRIPPQPDTAKKIRVAFQDPCRSGRQMPIDPVYEEPRELVKRVDNVELVELKTFRADAQCCGVAQMMYCNDKTKGLTAKRMDEATDVDADYLLVACPKCLTHFGCLHHENKWKPGEERYGFKVMDITQFLAERLPGEWPTGSNIDQKRKEPAARTAAQPAPSPTEQPPTDPLTAYYRTVRQMNLQLAKDRYKQGFKVRTQEYIRGRGTLAVVDEEICMGCTHCFDNCAFE